MLQDLPWEGHSLILVLPILAEQLEQGQCGKRLEENPRPINQQLNRKAPPALLEAVSESVPVLLTTMIRQNTRG